MDSDTTTSEPETQAVEEPQLESQETQTEAVNEEAETSQANDDVESEPVEEADNSEDTELKDWAAKKNLPLDDPMKMAKIIRDSEKQIGKQGQKEGQLKQAVSSANEASGQEDYQALKNEIEALSFYVNHPDAKQFETSMVDILEEKPYMASDLEGLLDMAKGRSLSKESELLEARKVGGKEALAQAEQAGRAAQPRVSATNRATATARITSQNVDEVISQHMGDAKWYQDHLSEINAALAG